jgi:DnaJ-class molecular chaperone
VVDMICSNCKGNGYVRLYWEANESIEQCSVCKSQGTLDEKKHYHQTWSDGVTNETTSFYYGPPLDPEGFKNYKIYGN